MAQQPARHHHLGNAPIPSAWDAYARDGSHTEVRVGELAVIAGGPPLRCRAVGATVAVCFSVPDHGLAGVLHVGFPSARQHRALAASCPLVFADRGIAALRAQLADAQIAPDSLRIGLVGAGSLLGSQRGLDGPQRLLRAVDVALTTNGFRVQQRHTGGSRARTLHQCADGRLLVMMMGGGE